MKTSNVGQGRAHHEAIIRGWVASNRAGSPGITIGDGSTTGFDINNLTVGGGGGTLTVYDDGSALLYIPGGGGTGTPAWFNVVEDYGATGDGTTDDTAAITAAIAALIAAGGGVLYFPLGIYKITSSLPAITVPCLVLGDGRASTDGTSDSISQIRFDTTTGTVFTVQSDNVSFSRLALYNGTGGTLTAGAGISVTSGGSWAIYEALSVYGFYVGIDIQEGGSWSMNDCHVHHFKKYGVKIRYISSPQGGDWSMVGCYIVDGAHNADSGIRYESSAGGKIVNCKINSNSSGINHGIDVVPVTTITDLQIINTSIEGVRGDGIHVASGAGAGFHHMLIVANQIMQDATYNTTGNGISIAANTAGDITGTLIVANTIQAEDASATGYAVKLVKTDRTLVSAILAGVPSGGYAGLLSQSGDTNLVDFTGGIGGAVYISGTPSSTGQVPTSTSTGTGAVATWQTPGASGAPTTADYLVGTAQAGLSAEIVVGTSPGGELGGTWASPTVDATHSGSAHDSAIGVKWTTGTSMPGSPATNQRITRTDLGMDFYYDGTRWLSVQKFRETFGVGNILPPATIATAIGRMTPWATAFDLWLEQWSISTYAVATNNGSHFWTLSLNKFDAADAGTVIDSVATSGDTQNNWTQRRRSIGASYVASSFRGLSVTTGITGSPGSLYFTNMALEYRLIGT